MCVFLFVVNVRRKSIYSNPEIWEFILQEAFPSLLDFQHRAHLSNVVMYYKYINVREGEGILLLSSTLSKLS